MGRTFHMCQSVTGPLANWTKTQWKQATKWMFKGDGSKFSSGDELKHFFIDRLGDGWRVLPMCDCGNFDKVKGCQGYETIQLATREIE